LDDNPLAAAPACQSDFGRKDFDGLKRFLGRRFGGRRLGRHQWKTNQKDEGTSQEFLQKHRNVLSPS
jgi:hypothetical protein